MSNKKLFIDLGAHNGDSIDKFYAQVSDANEYDIIAFEPNPIMFEILNHSIVSHNYKNVTTINMAAGTFTGVTELFVASMQKSDGSTLLYDKITGKVDYENPVGIKCIDFCDWLYQVESKYDYIILKTNIEGSEYPIMDELLKRDMVGKIDYYCIYFHSSQFEEHKRGDFMMIENRFIKEARRLGVTLCVNRHSFNEDNRQEILWVCDQPGWAYDKITIELSNKLSSFKHTKLFLCGPGGFRNIRGMAKAANLVVCLFPSYLPLFENLDNVMLRLDGFRAFEYAHDTICNEPQKVELESGTTGIKEAAPVKVQNSLYN